MYPLAPVFQAISTGSQDSLDGRHATLPHMKSYDAAVFEILRVQPEEFAVSIFCSRLTCIRIKGQAQNLGH